MEVVMNGKQLVRLALLTLIVLAGVDAGAQDYLNVICIGQYHYNWNDGVVDVAAQGDYAYLACNDEGLRIVNISTPGAYFDIADLEYSCASEVEVGGNYAFLGGYGIGVRVINISDPRNPLEVGVINNTGDVNAIEARGNHLFICSGNLGLIIADISDPANPQIISSSDFLGGAQDIDMHGNLAYVACEFGGLKVVDISNLAAPHVIATYQTGGGNWVLGAAVSGNYAFLASGWNGFEVVNLSTMQMVASIDSLNYGFRVKINGAYAYMTYGDPECPLAVIDISNPLAPQTTGIYIPPQDIVKFELAGDVAYIADFHHGLRVVDIADPYAPRESYRYSRFGHDWEVSILGEIACVREEYKIEFIDIGDPAGPVETGYYESRASINDFKIIGNMAYVLGSFSEGLTAVDISNTAAPVVVGRFDTETDVQYQMAIYDHYAYISENDRLRIIDIADPANMVHVGYFAGNVPHSSVEVFDHYAIIQTSGPHVTVLDLVNPLSPSIVDRYSIDAPIAEARIIGNYLYLATAQSLWIYDISDHEAWVQLSITPVLYTPELSVNGLDIYGNLAYVTADSLGLNVYDISDRAHPNLVGYSRTPGWACDVAIVGHIAVMADYSNFGLYDCSQVVSVDDDASQSLPQAVALLPNYPNPFNGSTLIQFELPTASDVTLDIFDILGRRILTLADGQFDAGSHAVSWGGVDAGGQAVASGRYYIQIRANNTIKSLPAILLK
jgi:hypothetical protein